MEQQLNPTAQLLQDIRSGLSFKRREAANGLRNVAESSEEIVSALLLARECDTNEDVKKAASSALEAPVHQAMLEQHPDWALQTLKQVQVRKVQEQEQARKERLVRTIGKTIFQSSIGIIIIVIVYFSLGIQVKSILGLPITYSEVLRTYPSNAKLCDVTGEIVSGYEKDEWEIILSGEIEIRDNKLVYPCYGTKVISNKAISVNGKRYDAGTKLTVDRNLKWVVITEW